MNCNSPKSIGIIKSQAWLEFGVPAFSAGIAIGSFCQKFKELEKSIGKMEKQFEKLEEQIESVHKYSKRKALS